MDAIDQYFTDHRIDPLRASQADLVLGLLRIGTPESLDLAEEVVGKPITKCPSAVPPWPPKPVKRTKSERRLVYVRERSPHPTSKLCHLRIGMTETQVHEAGISFRDIKYWTEKGHITWSQ